MVKKRSLDLNNGHSNPAFVPDGHNGSYKNFNPTTIGFEGYQKETQLNSYPPPQNFVVDKTVSISESDENDVPDRGQWSNQLEFLLSCISMSVGLGNVWRFPEVAYRNGGGAFLIPYLVVLFLVGRPIYFLELCIGQFCSQSQVKIWRCNPLFKGVGYASMIATLGVMSYYCSIMALTIFYFFGSFTKTLPWTECNDNWGVNCTEIEADHTVPIAELYFKKEVLKEKANINDGIGLPEWRMTLCLLAAWLVVYLSLIKGVKSSGKVAYFTALFPYVVLITLLIRGVTLDGAVDGIKAFLIPEWKKIYEPRVWFEAVSQCFFSLNTGFGSVIMFASYNPIRHNIYRDALILSIMDTLTSFIAGITVFAIIGYLSFETGVAIDKIMESGGGTTIAFVSYPTAIAKFGSAAPFFAVAFFLMLFTLGIGSATADAGAVISLIADKYPNIKRWHITTVLCSSAFLVGLVYVTPGGQFILTLVDYFGAAFVIFLTSILEVMGIIWVYGMSNFISDIEFMLGKDVFWKFGKYYWQLCWGIIIPIGLCIILVYSLVEPSPLEYNNAEFPTAAIVCGVILAIACLAPIPICAGIAIWKSKSPTLIGKIKEAASPADNWGPHGSKTRAEWIEYKKLNNRE